MFLLRAMVLLGCVFCVGLPQKAHADFGDCNDAGYLREFDGGLSVTDLECVEIFRIPLAGGGVIRGISDIRGGWVIDPAEAAGVEQGARYAAETLAAMGATGIGNITILLLDDADDLGSTDRRGEIGGLTHGLNTPAPGTDPECLITIFTFHRFGSVREKQVSTAHEIFHCVQFSLLPAQMTTYGAGGTWWAEGSAEYFAAVAVPDSRSLTNRGAGFDASVNANTPLYEMEHEASVFFMWWGVRNRPANLLPFLRQMATGSGAGPQRAVLRSVLGTEEWLDFVQAYADADIPHPQGSTVFVQPRSRHIFDVRTNDSQTVALPPFALMVGDLDYDCGLWGHRFRPSPFQARISPDLFDWQDWEEEVDARDGHPSDYRFIALNTGDSDVTQEIEFERRAACEPCAGSDALDACMAGIWTMTGGGPVEWMRAQGLPLTNVRESPRYVQFVSDGLYRAAPVGLELTITEGDMRGEAIGMSTQAVGTWSADKDTGDLHICQGAGGVSGTVTVESDGSRVSGPVSQPGAGEITMKYTCSPSGTLETRMQFPGLSDMVTSYLRISDGP